LAFYAAGWKSTAMARTTPFVSSSGHVEQTGAASPLLVGTQAWYRWLEVATTFAFVSSHGRFTARKERPARAGGYWKAYRKQAGRLHNAYLGKSADLNLDRLTHVANQLAEQMGVSAPATAPLALPKATAGMAELLATKLHTRY
jgi:hypothetical protein